MSLEGKKVLIIIAHEDFRDEEYDIPRKLLDKNGAQVTVASTEMTLAKGKLGMVVQPDVLTRDVRAIDYDAIILVGGPGAASYFNDLVIHGLLRAAVERGRVIAAICIAPVILANAGILANKKATVFPSEVDQIEAGGAFYTGREVERDGDILTASSPEAAGDFAEALVKAIEWKGQSPLR